MKVRQVIEISGWIDSQGYSYTQTYSDDVCEYEGDTIDEIKECWNWNWWEANEPEKGTDTEIVVKIYDANSDKDLFDSDQPMAKFSVWESDLWNEQNHEEENEEDYDLEM